MEVVTLGINRQNSETQGGENLVRINKKSDFPLAVRLLRGGQVVPFPDCDFTMEAHIEGSSEVYRAERKGGVCKHCKQDGDRLILFFDNHNFVEGRLLMELTIEYPDPDYSEDGIRQEHFVEIAPIQIVADNGDALDLRIPEPKVVERVVEKIVEVEKPVEKIVEKVVEKIIDNSTYTDLQKKAAEWVSRMIAEYKESDSEELEKMKMVLSGIFKFVDYGNLNSIGIANPSELFNGVSSSDEDFNTRLELAKFLISGIGRSNTSSLFSLLNAPELNLEIFIDVSSEVSLDSLFYGSTLNTITINAEGTDFKVNSASSLEEKLEESKRLSMFLNCTAKKVSVVSRSMMNDNYGWYILPSIFGSNVECFDFSGGGETKNKTFEISNIIERFLPDVTEENHKPNLIFRDYTGEVTEELKQKVLDKGYLSVEFYKGDTKVL
jgi:hypothetical protein